MPGTVADVGIADGPVVDIRLDCNGEALIARLTRYSISRLQFAPGERVYALVKSVALDQRTLSGPLPGGAQAAGDGADI